MDRVIHLENEDEQPLVRVNEAPTRMTPEGNVNLLIDFSSNGDRRFHPYIVCFATMRRVSGSFARAIAHIDRATGLRDYMVPHEIRIRTEASRVAVDIVLHIAHNHVAEVPTGMTADIASDVALFADQLEMLPLLVPWVARWCGPLYASPTLPGYERGLEYFFRTGDQIGFNILAKLVAMYSTTNADGNMLGAAGRVLDSYRRLSDMGLLGRIGQVRSEMNDQISRMIEDLLHRGHTGHPICHAQRLSLGQHLNAQGYTPHSSRHWSVKHHIDFMQSMLGRTAPNARCTHATNVSYQLAALERSERTDLCTAETEQAIQEQYAKMWQRVQPEYD